MSTAKSPAAPTLLAAGAVLAVYVALVALLPRHVFWSPDEGAKFVQLETMRWEGGWHYALPYPGAATDPAFRLYPSWCRNEDIYPHPDRDGVRLHWPIWFTLASTPFYRLLGLPGLYVLPVLGGWLAALLAGRLAALHDPRLAPAAILLAGLASPVAFYSLCYWEHTPATAFALFALWWVARGWDRGAAPWRLAAPALIAAVMCRIELAAFAVALGLAWVATHRVAARAAPAGIAAALPNTRRVVLGIGAAVLVGLAAVLVLAPRYRWYLPYLPRLALDNLLKLPHLPRTLLDVLVNAPGHEAPTVAPVWQALALVAYAAAGAAAFVRSPRVEAALLLPALLVAVEFSLALLFSAEPYISLHGLVPIAPYLIVGPYALAWAWRQRRYPELLVAATGVLYGGFGFGLIFSYLVRPDGTYQTGMEWGLRNLLTVYPIGAALAVVAVQLYRRSGRPPLLTRAFAALVVAMVAASVGLEVRGVQMMRESRQLVALWQSALPAGRPVVTDLWWLPARMAPFFVAHPMHCAREPERVREWLPAAAKQGVDAFVFASWQEIDPQRLAPPGLTLAVERHWVVKGLHVQQVRLAPAGADAGS